MRWDAMRWDEIRYKTRAKSLFPNQLTDCQNHVNLVNYLVWLTGKVCTCNIARSQPHKKYALFDHKTRSSWLQNALFLTTKMCTSWLQKHILPGYKNTLCLATKTHSSWLQKHTLPGYKNALFLTTKTLFLTTKTHSSWLLKRALPVQKRAISG